LAADVYVSPSLVGQQNLVAASCALLRWPSRGALSALAGLVPTSDHSIHIQRNGRLTLLALFRKKGRFLQSKVEHVATQDRESVSFLFRGLCGILYVICIGSGKRSRFMAFGIRRPWENEPAASSPQQKTASCGG
jgi:hypothetical protein